MEKIISKNVKDTLQFAEKFAKKINNPCIILLHGDLGAGKTHFVKGFTKGLKCKMQVTSPTFTIMNTYEGGKMKIYHFDMYRLISSDEAIEAGLEEYLNLETLDGVSIVEWPENIQGLIVGDVIDVTIKKTEKEDERIIIVEGIKC